jgi:hypothetical protein
MQFHLPQSAEALTAFSGALKEDLLYYMELAAIICEYN